MFLARTYRCLGVIRALVSFSESVSLSTHNPKVGGSNPPRATKLLLEYFRVASHVESSLRHTASAVLSRQYEGGRFIRNVYVN